VGKIALYTAGAGIHPTKTLSLDLDVGTDNPSLLDDPLYLGARHARLRGGEYFSLIDEVVNAIRDVFPIALVQWEDFANQQAFEVLQRSRRRVLSFDDDIQGTGAIVEAGIRTALDRAERRFKDERIVLFGAGASGAGIALQLRQAMRAEGIDDADLSRRVLCLDSRGLILSNRPGLGGHKREIAADPAVTATWMGTDDGRFTLMHVVREFRPTILIGASGQPGSFTESIVRTMHAGCDRPIVLALSNPTAKIEAHPADILAWTNGAAIVGTGSPFAPVRAGDVTYQIGQGNNVFVFPGVGLGATAVDAEWLPDAAFAAAAHAVYESTDRTGTAGASIFPPLSRLRDVSYRVAVAVGRALIDAGAAPPLAEPVLEQRVRAAMWNPEYLPYRAG
jgi:malate dehydrogenase (oxaloacetate-decarboxylating)